MTLQVTFLLCPLCVLDVSNKLYVLLLVNAWDISNLRRWHLMHFHPSAYYLVTCTVLQTLHFSGITNRRLAMSQNKNISLILSLSEVDPTSRKCKTQHFKENNGNYIALITYENIVPNISRPIYVFTQRAIGMHSLIHFKQWFFQLLTFRDKLPYHFFLFL